MEDLPRLPYALAVLKEAMRLYAKLPVNAEACASCSAPCLGSCPVGIPIAERTRGAHQLLTLA